MRRCNPIYESLQQSIEGHWLFHHGEVANARHYRNAE